MGLLFIGKSEDINKAMKPGDREGDLVSWDPHITFNLYLLRQNLDNA